MERACAPTARQPEETVICQCCKADRRPVASIHFKELDAGTDIYITT